MFGRGGMGGKSESRKKIGGRIGGVMARNSVLDPSSHSEVK
jgi:hypothetical protein